MSEDLRSLLTCPACRRGDLEGLAADLEHGKLTCTVCGEVYEVHHGVPILVPSGVNLHRGHDELDHFRGHKRQQAAHFDHAVAEEFETVRPHGTPRAHRWLLGNKLARAVSQLPGLRGTTVVVT